MPGSDGELINALRGAEKGGTVPVIALTGSVAARDRERVRAAGFALHLTKPVDPTEVIEAVSMAASGQAREFARRRSE
jgi:CheY-like chemotaxis protein